MNLDVFSLIEKSAHCLGEIQNITSDLAEFDFVVQALKNIESLTSARIEGTTGNLQDLYLEDALDFERKRQLKLFSAMNYRLTMNGLEGILKKRTRLSLPLIRQLHKQLTQHDPATTGIPGKFRKKSVKIANSRIGDFFPPEGVAIDALMSQFIKETNNRHHTLPDLINTAITHYQFEAIHPFEDGNGRTGRLLINAQLLIHGKLDSPVLNLSQYFDEHRSDYLKALRHVSDEHTYLEWVTFFLRGVVSQCEHNIALISRLRKLKEKEQVLLNESTHTPVIHHVHRFALNHLYLTCTQVEQHLIKLRLKLKDPRQTAWTNVKKLESLGLIKKTKHKLGRSDMYVHKALRDILFSESKHQKKRS